MIARLVIIALIISSTAYASEMQVNTGYGYYVKDGKIIGKAELPKGVHDLDESIEYVEVESKAELDAIEVYEEPEPLIYNDKRFKASLLNDAELSAFGFTVFYPSISDCLQYQNWDALNTVLGLMVSEGAATAEQVQMFKAKILSEEGVDLNA